MAEIFSLLLQIPNFCTEYKAIFDIQKIVHTMQRSLSMERNWIPLCFTMYEYIYVSSYRPDDGHVIDRNM